MHALSVMRRSGVTGLLMDGVRCRIRDIGRFA